MVSVRYSEIKSLKENTTSDSFIVAELFSMNLLIQTRKMKKIDL